jgi:uncharacterized membrane protein YraQ (UPF0718 family)
MNSFLRGGAVSLFGVVALGALVGWDGASRAVAIGAFTLMEDHPAALVAAGLLVGVAASLSSRRLRRSSAVGWFATGGVVGYLVIGVALSMAIPELNTRSIPAAIISVTGLGTQPLALAMGVVLGRIAALRGGQRYSAMNS